MPPLHTQTWTATHHHAVQCELPGQHLGPQRGGVHTSGGHHGLWLPARGDSARRHCHHRPVHRQVIFVALTWKRAQLACMCHSIACLLWVCCILSCRCLHLSLWWEGWQSSVVYLWARHVTKVLCLWIREAQMRMSVFEVQYVWLTKIRKKTLKRLGNQVFENAAGVCEVFRPSN